MSGESKKRRKKSEAWNSSTAGCREGRTVSCVSEMSTNSFHSALSPEARDTVLKLKKIPDPFSDEMQDIFDDFVTHVDESTYETINLSEAGLLLSGATKIYSAQVSMLQKWTNELAEFVTKTEKKVKEKKDPVERSKDEQTENQVNGEVVPGVAVNENSTNEVTAGGELSEQNSSQLNPEGGNNEGNVSSTEAAVATNECDNLPESNLNNGDANLDPNCKPLNEDESVSPNTAVPEDGNTGQNEMELLEGVLYDPLSNPATKSHVVLGPGPVTRKRLMCFKDLLYIPNDEPVRKKDRFEVVLAPKLISYDEEMEDFDELLTYRGDENPPTLELIPPFPEKRKRKIQDLGEKGEDKLENKEQTDKPAEAGPATQGSENNSETVQNNAAQNLAAASIPDFAPEDQSSILECINELHYLPFTFELSNSDLSMAFSKTVDRICSIFQKYNVPLSRAMIKAASAMCSGMVPNEGSPPNGVNDTLHKLNGIQETLIKNFGSVNVEQPQPSSGDNANKEAAAVEAEINKEKEVTESPTKKMNKTIFESTEEKTVAQSRETIKAMIAEMQRSIVPKYARIPMMAENTPEFFMRVFNFEKKMRKVLDAEATKEEFDVRKYEKEVLESTTKETLEQEKLEDELQVPLSPFMPSVLDQPSDDETTNDLDLNFQGCSSSRSSFEGSQCSTNSSRWVPLSNIFRHMKKLEKVEACRMFYAVLALLSYQNLDINYDQLYSEESARLTNKAVDHDQDGKYARGMKIMTSRCPDVDKGEVYIAALTSKSHTESFRELLAQDSHNLNNNNEGTDAAYNEEMNYGIREQKAAFVEEVGLNFSGQLYGKRGRRPKKAAPIPFIPIPLRR